MRVLSKKEKMRLHVALGAHAPVDVMAPHEGSLAWDFQIGVADSLLLELSWRRGGGTDFEAPWMTLETSSPLALGSDEQMHVPLSRSAAGAALRVSYEARRRYSPEYGGIMCWGRVTGVALVGPPAVGDDLWRAFCATEAHYVVAMARIGPPGRQQPVYLGRPQRCATVQGTERRYQWEEEEEEENVEKTRFPSPRSADDFEAHAREAAELARIRNHKAAPALPVTEMDNERTHNGRRVLPVTWPSDQCVQFQFFNLRESALDGVAYAETPQLGVDAFQPKPQRQSLTFSPRLSARRSVAVAAASATSGTLRIALTAQLRVALEWRALGGGGDTLSIVGVTLDAHDYARALLLMGSAEGPRTV